MRPIIGTGGSNPLGANANGANPRPTEGPVRAYDGWRLGGIHPQRARSSGAGSNPSNPGYFSGVVATNATFKDSHGYPFYDRGGRPIGAAQFAVPYMGPSAIVVMRPKVRGLSHQVTNPDGRRRMPGWTYQLPVNFDGQIARAIRRPYMGSGSY